MAFFLVSQQFFVSWVKRISPIVDVSKRLVGLPFCIVDIEDLIIAIVRPNRYFVLAVLPRRQQQNLIIS